MWIHNIIFAKNLIRKYLLSDNFIRRFVPRKAFFHLHDGDFVGGGGNELLPHGLAAFILIIKLDERFYKKNTGAIYE